MTGAASQGAAPKASVGDEIVAWLHGLENCLNRTLRDLAGPEEQAQLSGRRGIYDGIADDIKRKWPALFPATPKGGKTT